MKGHTCATGCNYQAEHCFSKNILSFTDIPEEPEAAQECPMAAMFQVINEEGFRLFSSPEISNQGIKERAYFRRVSCPDDPNQFQSLEQSFQKHPEFRSFCFGDSNLSSEEAATFLYLDFG